MNAIQTPQHTTSMNRRPCPPPPPAPRGSPIFSWSGAASPSTNETTFSWGAPPTWTLPPPPNRSGALSVGDREATHSWSDLILTTEPKSLRQLTIPMEPAILPSQQAEDIIHPNIKDALIRQRGSYWWEKSQAKLELEFSSGKRQPVQGGFYVFLEEEQGDIVVRYGNVLERACWRMQTVAFPKGHPDADVPPYQMIDARQ